MNTCSLISVGTVCRALRILQEDAEGGAHGSAWGRPESQLLLTDPVRAFI